MFALPRMSVLSCRDKISVIIFIDQRFCFFGFLRLAGTLHYFSFRLAGTLYCFSQVHCIKITVHNIIVSIFYLKKVAIKRMTFLKNES